MRLNATHKPSMRGEGDKIKFLSYADAKISLINQSIRRWKNGTAVPCYISVCSANAVAILPSHAINEYAYILAKRFVRVRMSNYAFTINFLTRWYWRILNKNMLTTCHTGQTGTQCIDCQCRTSSLLSQLALEGTSLYVQWKESCEEILQSAQWDAQTNLSLIVGFKNSQRAEKELSGSKLLSRYQLFLPYGNTLFTSPNRCH